MKFDQLEDFSDDEIMKPLQPAPSVSYSFTMRLTYPNRIGMFARIVQRHRQAWRRPGRGGYCHARCQSHDAGHHRARPRPALSEQILAAARRASTGVKVVNVSDRVFLLHLGGKIWHPEQGAAHHARRAFDGLHAGRGAGLRGHRRRPAQSLATHHQRQLGRRRQRRHRRAGPGRHRPGSRHARDGRQGDVVQGIRRH